MPYRGFSDYEIITLVVTGQASACGRGEGILGALNWIDACRRTVCEKPNDIVRQSLIVTLTLALEKSL
jgi:hypothetical protein